MTWAPFKISTNKKHYEVIQEIYSFIDHLKLEVKYCCIESHQDDTHTLEVLDRWEQLNIMYNILAKNTCTLALEYIRFGLPLPQPTNRHCFWKITNVTETLNFRSRRSTHANRLDYILKIEAGYSEVSGPTLA